MNEFLLNRIEKRYRCKNRAELSDILNNNYKEIFHNEGKITKIMTVYFNTESRLDSRKTIRSKIYINDMFNNIESALDETPCDLQVKFGCSKDGISVIKEKNTTYGKVINQLKDVENSNNDFKSDIMEYIKKLTSNQNLSPFMKIYYCRHYYIGEIEQNEIRITVDEDIVFENCLTNEKKTLNESIMEIKAEKNESFDEDVLASAIETIFKKACIQRSTSKKMLGYTLVM